MLGSATRVLRLVFSRPADDAVLPDTTAVDLVGYCEEFVFSGTLELDADRLTDLLNGCDEIELVDVVVQSLESDELLTYARTVVPRSSLLAARAGEPRGNPTRRRLTRQTPVTGVSGPYAFDGYLHSLRGADPSLDLARRAPMVPLTDSTIRFCVAGSDVVHTSDTLIVNRDIATSMRVAGHSDRLATA